MRNILAATALAALALTGCGSQTADAPAPTPTYLPGYGVSDGPTDGTRPRPTTDGPSLLDCTTESPCTGSIGNPGPVGPMTGSGGSGGTYEVSR